MFKKITSNRDPRDTVLSEIKKEFRPYINNAGGSLKRLADHYPKFLFVMMVINIVLSAILCFTVLRHKEEPKKTKASIVPNPIANGFEQITEASAALKETIRLKKAVDSITHKRILTKADSTQLGKDLDSLQEIHLKINH